MDKFTYGEFEIDPSQFPPKTIFALVRRGVAHYLGNEMASKVSAEVDKLSKPSKSEDGTEIPGRTVSDDEKAALKARFQAEGFKALLEGTIGDSTRGPRVDPFTAECQKLAKEGVLAILRAKKAITGTKLPADDATWKFGDETLSFGTLKDRFLARHKVRIEGEARKNIEAKRKRDEKLAREAESLPSLEEASAEALGF